MHRQGPNWSLLNHASSQARAICQRMLNWDERMRPTAQQCLGHAWFKENGVTEAGEVEEVVAEDPGAGQPPLTARAPPSEAVVQAVGDYMGRSKFEKAILLQVASQLHTGQMGRVYEVFTAADKDNSGDLSREELINALSILGVDRGDAESYVQCIDSDSNGCIEYTELASGCIGLLYAELRGLLWQSFCILDVDGNGVLGKDEVLAVVTRAELIQHGFPGSEPVNSVSEVIATLDLDSNGQISFDELCRVFLQRPTVGVTNQATEDRSRVHAMQDEEFAQLLDEIEADQQKGHVEPNGTAVDLDLTANLAAVSADANDVNEPASFGISDGQASETIAEMHANVGRLSVDEELSHLLADIANGP